MNWNGGALSRWNANTSLSAAQKRYFAKAKARARQIEQALPDLDFPTLTHARIEERACQRRSRPVHCQSGHLCSSSQVMSSSPKKRPKSIPSLRPSPSAAAFPSSTASSSLRKEGLSGRGSYDGLESQKRQLLAMNDWCGLKTNMPICKKSKGNADVVPDGRSPYIRHERPNYRPSKKRRRSDSIERNSHLDGLTGKGSAKSKFSSRRTRDSQSAEQTTRTVRHSSPSQEILEAEAFPPYYSLYMNSDEDLFADDLTKIRHSLFQRSPPRNVDYDWSDIKWDMNASASSPPDNGLTPEPSFLVEHVPHTSDNILREVICNDSAPRLNFDILAQHLIEKDIDLPPEKNEGLPITYAQWPKPFTVGRAPIQSIRSSPSVNTELPPDVTFLHLGPPKTQSISHNSTRARNNREDKVIEKATDIFSLCGPTSATENSIRAIKPAPRTIESEELLLRDSGWRDFVIGSEDEDAADDECYEEKRVKRVRPEAIPKIDEQQPADSWWKDFVIGNEDADADDRIYSIDEQSVYHEQAHLECLGQPDEISVAPSSPHQFTSGLYSASADEQSVDHGQANLKSRRQPKGTSSASSSPHQFAFTLSGSSYQAHSSVDIQEVDMESHSLEKDLSSTPSSPHQFSPVSSNHSIYEVQSVDQQQPDWKSHMQREQTSYAPASSAQDPSSGFYSDRSIGEPLSMEQQQTSLESVEGMQGTRLSTTAEPSSSPYQLTSPSGKSINDQQQPAKRVLRPTFIFIKPARFEGGAVMPSSTVLGFRDSRRRISGETIPMPRKSDEEEDEYEELDEIEDY